MSTTSQLKELSMATKTKKPGFKTLESALRRIVLLQKHIKTYEEICTRMERQKILLAKLASKEPQFFNPLEAMAAETVRDEILAKLKR